MTNIANIEQLSVVFQTDTQSLGAVDSVSFCLKRGETLALLGESGCGKSLTSLALMRLLPASGVYGRNSAIMVAEHDVLNLPEHFMRMLRGRALAMIFQEPMTALNPVLTIGIQLAEAIKEHQQMTRAEEHARMLALLTDVELSHPELCLQQYPHQLSGGQKQRVVIAMALACNPDVLIADEPTTALDVTIQAQILALLKKLQTQYHMSLLLITHDLSVVKAMADTVCVMYAGQIVESSPATIFFKGPRHPYAQQLFLSLPTFEKRAKRLQTIAGNVPTLDSMPTGCRFHPRCAHAFSPCGRIEPQLQALKSTRTVRCHLYPEHKKPPALSLATEDWNVHQETDDIILSVENLSVHFGERHGMLHRGNPLCKAVDELSFVLHKGTTLALVGESGCGKTTTSRALLRLQPITSGRVIFQGQNVRELRGRALCHFRKKVQIIFQDPYSSMNPRMTVDQILAEGMQAQGMRAAFIQKRQHELLEQVNLPRSSLYRYPHQFSGGQRQRIGIARALATGPELLICDEPTSALDMSVQAQILNLLKSLQQEFGLTYLFITHNMGVVSYIADEVLVMREGKAIEQGTCEQVLIYPQADYTRQLLGSVLRV